MVMVCVDCRGVDRGGGGVQVPRRYCEQEGRNKQEGEAGIRDAETNVADYSTNSQNHVERLWVKCKSGALVWFGNLETDKGTEAEVSRGCSCSSEEHSEDLVAKKNL